MSHDEDPTFAHVDWVAEEQAQGGVLGELKRLGRRAGKRWGVTLLLALAATGIVVGLVARQPHLYVSRIAFRIQASETDADSTPKTNRQLYDYVSQSAFSSANLVAIMKEHQLYAPLRARDPLLAVEEMRDDIEVTVWRNDFDQRRTDEQPAQSARLGVAFRGRDREKVFAVVQELGRLILEQEKSARLREAEAALRIGDDEVTAARQLLAQQQAELVEKAVAQRTARTPADRLRLLAEARTLEKALPRAQLAIRAAEQRRERALLRMQLATRALGLTWVLMDAGHVAPPAVNRSEALAILAAVVFLLALPLAAIVVGAVDSRIYDLGDVQRLGLPVVGAVRHFAGDNAGALEERLRGPDRPVDGADQSADGWAW